MNDKPKCGCERCKKYRKMVGVSECFSNKTDAIGIFEAYTFQKNKPFKVTFNEGVDVTWNFREVNEQKSKKLTERDVEQKEEMVKKLKDKMSDFTERYGKRAKGVMYAVATKHAKETP